MKNGKRMGRLGEGVKGRNGDKRPDD